MNGISSLCIYNSFRLYPDAYMNDCDQIMQPIYIYFKNKLIKRPFNENATQNADK